MTSTSKSTPAGNPTGSICPPAMSASKEVPAQRVVDVMDQLLGNVGTLQKDFAKTLDTVKAELDQREFDEINKASHYNQHPSGVEAIELLRLMPFNLGTAMKYVIRAGLKDANSAEKDLRKAEYYLKDEMRHRSARRVNTRQRAIGELLVTELTTASEPKQAQAINLIWWAAVDMDADLLHSALAAVRDMLADVLTPTSSGEPRCAP